MKHFLVINPGSTSTKCALYQGFDPWSIEEVKRANLKITKEQTEEHPEPMDQLPLRLSQVEAFLRDLDNPDLDAVAGRGGLTKALEAGSYSICSHMLDDLKQGRYGVHASNLGAFIAKGVADERRIPALISDPVGVDQFIPQARYSGWPSIPRSSQLHALNIRSVARETARKLGKELDQLNCIVAHLGGGISIVPIKLGRMIDVNNAMDAGPFSPQRCGTLPMRGLLRLAFSGTYASADAMIADLTRNGGLRAYLGTDDGKVVENRVKEGDAKAKEIYEAMAYQIGKEIGSAAAVLKGELDRIILTGGLPWPPLSDWICEYCEWIAPVEIIPGERELLALAQAAARHICEGELLKSYT